MAKWINDGLHETSGVIHSFLLAGQSNMAGRGDLTAENALSAPGCLMLRMGRWQPMSEPVNVDRAVLPGASPRSGACLASSFAARYAAGHGCQAGLIPCADGGTTIAQWQPGQPLFDHAVMQAKLAARTMGADGFAATRMARGKDGLYTGEVDGPVVAGAEKYRAVERWCNARFGVGGWRLERAYADHHTDADLLARAQHAYAVCPGKTFIVTAKRAGWPILDWDR